MKHRSNKKGLSEICLRSTRDSSPGPPDILRLPKSIRETPLQDRLWTNFLEKREKRS